MQALKCTPDTAAYQTFSLIYDRLAEQVKMLVVPQAAYVFVETDKSAPVDALNGCRYLLYCLITIGEAVSAQIAQVFRAGLYLEGLVIDAIANYILFDCTRQLHQRLLQEANAVGLKLSRRYAPGDGKVDAAFLQAILAPFAATDSLGVTITEGYMLEPVKSLAYVYGADALLPQNQIDLACTACSRQDCNLRAFTATDTKVTITVCGDKPKTIYADTGQTIMAALAANGIRLQSPCGGLGICGKCKVKVLSGCVKPDSPLGTADNVFLACSVYPLTDLVIETLLSAESNLDNKKYQNSHPNTCINLAVDIPANQSARPLGLAIDIGTTTLVTALVDLISGQVIKTYSMLNSQRRFGADIISRIVYATDHPEVMRSTICSDIIFCSRQFGVECKDAIKHIAVVGNTTMLHFLLGLPTQPLGSYPFQPVTTALQELTYAEVFADASMDVPVTLLPGLSAFIGADVVAGLLQCGFAARERIAMLIDIGTNGEIAIGNKHKILCLATAAGPAFEGGNISCGMGSVSGAIVRFAIVNQQNTYVTIDDKAPVGVCGSGVIDIMAACVKAGMVDNTGKLDSAKYPDGVPLAQMHNGKWLYFSQKDIRELQLAKAAIRAGVEIALKRYGCTFEDVETVYLAGSFGAHLSIDNAVCIGLLPQRLAAKVEVVGNSALGGAVSYLLSNSSKQQLADLLAVMSHVDLALDPVFNEYFIKHLDLRSE